MMMLHDLQGSAWRLERDMEQWYLGGRPNLLLEQEGDDPINENESAETSSSRFCLSLRE